MLNSTVLFESIAVRGSARPVALLRDVQAECCFCNCLFWRNWGSDNFCDSFGGLLRLENISFLCSTPNAACGFVLSNSLAPSSRIHLKRSAMHSFSVNSMNPFLSAGKMESVAVDECHFENITHKPDAMRRKGLAEERELVGNEIGTIEVESSSFNEVACADFGCIFDGYHTFHHYLSFNCSFVTSRAQANNTRQVNSSGNVVLRDSLFTIVSEVYDGAAVLITGNATLTIERTTFLSCKSTAYSRDNGGGAISATGTGFIIITNSSFNNNSCASNYGGAIRIFSKSAGDVSIEDSTFIENEGPHYGAFQITGQNDYVIVDSCTFYRNKASTYYGESSGRMYAGTFFILCDTEDVNPTEIRFLYFDQNTCGNNKGTDIAIRTTNLTFYVASNFTTCFSTSLEKRIVFCTNVSEWECAAYEPRENWIQSANTSSIHVDPLKEDNVVCGNVGRECKTIGFAITRWLQPERQKVHVSRVNHLETSIAINGQTVETSIKGSGDRPTITSKNLDGWLVTIATGSFTVTDFSIVVDTGVSLESSLFLVSNAEGKLNLVQCEISADSTNRMLEHSQFSLLGGSVNLTLCEIRGFSLRECGLFQKESASSLLFEGGSVCDIARSRGNGTIIGKTLGDGEILAISNITFRNCTSSAENGGAFGLCLGSGSQLRIGQTSEVGFEECSAPNSENKGKGGALYLLFDQGANDFILKSISFRGCRAWKGKNVFVDGSNLSSLVKASSFAFKPQTGVELADLDELSGYDAGDRSKVIPLVLYLRTFSSPAYVSGSESDADDTFCGYKDYPCRTVEGAAAFRFANSACELSLLPSFAFLKELTLASQSYVFGAASQGQATEVGSSSVKSREMLVSVSVPATFANITFLLNHSIGNRASFISLQSATLSLTSCSIGKTSETESIEYTAVMASGGVLTVNLLSVAADQALSFSAPMLLLSGSVVCNLFCANLSSIATTGPQSFVETSSSGLANITNCSFGGFSLAKRGVIHSENGGSLYVGCSSFADVSLSSGNGSCIDFAAGEDVLHCVTVFNCSFQGCSVLNDGQSGGGIFASLKSSCKLLINSTSFLSCTAPSEMQSGFGGGISLFVLQTDASFAIDAPSFSDELPNKAKCGNDIFVSSPDLASSVNRESFCFYDEQNPFSAASCVGVDEKWEILMIPLVCYFRVLGDAVCVSAEGSDVPVCGYIDFGCRTLDFSFARLPERKKAVTILNEYAVGESCVLSDAKGYGISGLETKTRLKMEGNETQATSVMEVRAAVFFSCFFIEMVSSLHSTKSAVFSVADSNGVLEIENCECQPESGVSSISYCLFATKAGKLAVNGFVMSNVQFSAGAAVAVNESGACEIVNMIFENVTSSANGKIMKYSSTGEMNVNKSHFSSSMASASPMIFDGNGAVLCVSNTTFSEIGRSEGQGGAVEGVVGDGCRMVLEEVVFLDCCTVDGCGGGLGLSVSGTGHLEIGKEELNSVFKSCAAKKGNGNGGKGGGIFIGFSGEVFDYVICHTIFGAETEKNEAEEKGENIFIEGDDLSRIVTQRRFAVECDVSKEKHNEFVGFDRNADKHVPLASFLSNWTSPVFVNSEEGADYQSCGFSWYPCSSIVYAAENRFAGGVAAVCLEPNFSIADKLVLSAMPMVINGVSKPERVNIAADGRESGDGFVITQNEVTISWLEFCAPCEFLHVQRKSLVLCAGSKLVVEGCSMVMQSGNPSYRFLLITSGSVKLTEFNLNSIEFKEAPAIELVGAQTSGVFDKLHLESVNTTCESGGVIFVSSALAAQIENSTINSTSLLRQTAICVKGGASLTLKKSNFSEVNRTEGNGGVVVGEVDSEKRIEIKECNFAKVIADALISSIKQSILCGKGSTITLTSVTFSELVFEADQAICAMQSGSLIISGCTFASICTSKKSLIGGMEGTCVAINNTQISECSSESGSVVHWENALEVEIANTSSFAKCSSEKDNGGAVNLIFSRNYRLSIADVSFSNNSADEKAKNGGAIFVQLSQDLDEAIEFSSLHFLGNKAHHGKDMFVACADLNRTVLQSRFQFHLVNEEGELIVDLFGRDEVITSKEAVNLTLFLLQLQSSSIHVSAAGHDYLGCGSDEYPCNTFWRGYTNMDKTGSDQKLLTVDASTVVQDTYDVSSFSIIPGYGSARSSIVVKSDLELCTLDSIFLSAKSLSIQNMLLSLPTSFAPPVQNLLRLNPPRASEAQLAVKGCVFECSSGSCIDYILISSAKGRVELADCTLPSFSSGVIPLDLSSSVLIKGMNFTNIASASSGEGGVAKVELTEEESLSINGTTAEGCSCARNGRGGAFFVKCSGSLLPAPFVFGSEIILADNEAMIGKNVFVASSDLNRTVTKSTFVFLAEKAKMEHTLFCGSDAVHRDTDLLRFLCGYKNNTIFVSSNGFDIARCGSEDDPCESFWKGMAQIERSSPSKVITVDGSTFVRDAFIVSNYTIASYSASPDEARKAVVGFQNKRINDGEPFLTNAVRLSLERMSLRVAEHFDGSASSIVHSKEGILLVRMCSFESKGLMEDLSKVQFVTVEGGELAVDDLTMSSSNFAENIFAVNNMAQLCTFTSLSVSSLNLSDGSIFSLSSSIGQETKQNSNWRCDFRINESTFSSIARVDDGTGVVFSGINNIDLKVDKTVFSDVKAERSMKGGVMLVSLLSEGSFKMSDSTVTRCCCSSNGKGGGVYLAAATAGKLDFLFSRVNFTANTAFVGNDIFIECHNITAQINETQFGFDVEKVTDKAKAIFGIDKTDHSADTNLLDFITIYRADTIIVSSDPSRNGKDDRQCGTQYLPCLSIDYGLLHLSNNFVSQMFVDKASYLGGEAKMVEMGLTSRTKAQCVIEVHSSIPQHELALISTAGSVSLSYLRFAFAEEFVSLHSAFLCPETGVLELSCCAFTSESYDSAKTVPFCLISANGCKCTAYEVSVSFLAFASPMFHVASSGNMKITSSSFSESSFEGSLAECGEDSVVQTVSSSFTSINVSGRHPMLSFNGANEVAFENCSFISCLSCTQRGSIVSLSLCTNATIDKCLFDGWKGDNKSDEKRNTQPEEICRWNGSLVDFAGTRAAMKDTAIVNSSEGGMSICGGEVSVEKGEYYGNSKAIDGFPSARRNIICESKGQLAMESLKGGDGLLPNTSLWILNEGCELSGMASERASELFIPALERVETEEKGARTELTFRGNLLLPCNLSCQITSTIEEVSSIEVYLLEEDGFVCENEARSSITSGIISSAEERAEVAVCILFGNPEKKERTESFVVKNKTEKKREEDGNNEIVKSERNKGKSSWAAIIAIIFVVLFLIVLIALVIFIVRWKKQKKRTEELEVIVEDTVKKDPKAFEMVTMELSPEEQWRRDEREAEKKNEERVKKRVYEKSLGHSESSEHLLSESGSTEYILGKDSDKIPDWALEKVEEEEETRKRSPSPSISSTSTTSTTDSDSTFVRGEDMCPTTSSMSNLVDAMDCSSPHEKLILDLRDSFFMLMHGRNKTKEMAIGSVEEREVTGAQVLFWVANLALHSFDEMSNPLSSLENLSPHIVLFSEHMDIAIALHSDCSSSSEDSDSSSISSLTIVSSSSSNVSVMSERFTDSPPPSSAFEDCEDNRDECKRWKAPELLMNRKMCATKQSVAFSIGMMLWECVTLEIPFGEYEAGIAGDKIVKGERPRLDVVEDTTYGKLIGVCLSPGWEGRPMLSELKKEFFVHFPAEAKMLTVSDAIGVEEEEGGRNEHSGGEGSSMVDDGGNGNDVGNGDEEGDAKTTR
ncbi:uncharacterized protein MONOS_4387 [Monocercomonoides exilis]|uniref:uncharacterized protein n=1 Tax=Monocercomonoides exilis TaxID=2049356 RepID=UPI00355A30D1|nr:hypothetical protein MONOS_4387 [Monocercomonoides exilis]